MKDEFYMIPETYEAVENDGYCKKLRG